MLHQGEGSALLERTQKLERVIGGMCAVSHSKGVPITAKLRTGVTDKKLLAHTLLPRLRDAGLSLATVRLMHPAHRPNPPWPSFTPFAKLHSSIHYL